MKRRKFLGLATLALLGLALPTFADPSRILTTQFAYTATVPASPAGTKAVNFWLPIPSDSAWQTVTGLTVIAPITYKITSESHYGNRMVYLRDTTPTEPLRVTVQFTVARRQVSVLDNPSVPAFSLAADTAPDRRVPVGGRFTDIAKNVTGNDQGALQKEHDLFKHVVATMHYDYKKSSPEYAQGDSAFVCDYKSGNCSDLHSYLISLSRSLGIPAVLEFGFPLTGIPVPSPLPTDGKIAGYHCWVWFEDPQKGWVPLDAADARRWADSGRTAISDSLFGNLVLERTAVAVSRGRDLTLSPPQKNGPLNYFIYPYAEADGQTTPATWTLSYHVVSDRSH
ncbi:MAG: transglutaminase-like domain-containing protein [Janthinobacterium lividum]